MTPDLRFMKPNATARQASTSREVRVDHGRPVVVLHEHQRRVADDPRGRDERLHRSEGRLGVAHEAADGNGVGGVARRVIAVRPGVADELLRQP